MHSFSAFPVEDAKQSDFVTIAITRHGGHIGFMEGAFPRHEGYSDRLFAEYAAAVFTHGEELKQATSVANDLNLMAGEEQVDEDSFGNTLATDNTIATGLDITIATDTDITIITKMAVNMATDVDVIISTDADVTIPTDVDCVSLASEADITMPTGSNVNKVTSDIKAASFT